MSTKPTSPTASAPDTPTASTTPTGRAQLKLSYNGTDVVFPYNPTSISFGKGLVTEGQGSIAQNSEQLVTDLATLTFDMKALRLEGKKALKYVATLLSWLVLEPSAPTTGAPTESASGGKGNNSRSRAKVLQVSMGTGQGYQKGDGISGTVILKKVDVTYTRFDSKGDPIRAEVTIKLETIDEPPKKTNPTSFSPTSGRVHLTTEGDNLQRIAQQTYANPSAWRDIAAANGIDDPMRVRNGRALFLPYARS